MVASSLLNVVYIFVGVGVVSGVEEKEGQFVLCRGKKEGGRVCVLAHKAQLLEEGGPRKAHTYRMMASTLMAAFSSFCCASRLATSRWATLFGVAWSRV